ncbi:MAG: beta-galactosidase, partial [Bacteroidota bacterium]|nr:beta-galactosidase [Bacteroidota bacterium]
MKKALIIALAFSIFTLAVGQKEVQSLQLAGKWQFKADPSDQGINEQWYAQNFHDFVSLPGSMATNGLGDDITLKTPWTGQIVDSSLYKSPEYEKYRQPGHIKIPSWLQPVKYYKGAAWYQKSIIIPASWKGKHLELFIERSHWETTVWLDNHLIGMQNSLNTPQVFDLDKYLKTGKHKLTLRIDNRVKVINFGQNSHSISDHTQTNWNGMIGRLCINARPALFINDVQLFPDLKSRQVIAKIKIRNLSGKAVQANLKLTAIPENPQEKSLISKAETVKVNSDSLSLEVACNMDNNPLLWDEFHPNLYKMKITLTSGGNAKDEKNITFGMREF